MTDQLNKNVDELSLTEIYHLFCKWLNFLKKKLVKIFLISIFGGLVGFIYAYLQPVNYVSKLTFVVEEGKSGASNLGGLASLAGQFGVDVGGASGQGVLSNDNIQLYFKSPSLSKEVLLSNYNDNSKLSVADVYVGIYRLKKKWGGRKYMNISFPPLSSNAKYSRLQDSLLQCIISDILKYQFEVKKADKKTSMVDVITTMQEEKIAELYCERIVNVAVKRYIDFKTKRQKSTVDNLQTRVDSIANLLRQKTISGASLQTSAYTMDINPLYKTGTTVATETTLRDKAMLSTIFASVVQNLELAKFTLSQETPVIQIIDTSSFPLKKIETSKVKSTILFALAFGFLMASLLVINQIFKENKRL